MIPSYFKKYLKNASSQSILICVLSPLQAHTAGQDKRAGVTPKDENEVSGMVGGTHQNPLGRASLARPIAPAGPEQAATLERASVVGIKKSSLTPGGVQLARRSVGTV